MVNKAHWPHIRQKHVKFCRADKLLCITCRKGREVPSRPRPSRVNPSFRIMSRPGFETLSPGPTPVMTGVGTPSPRPILVVSPSALLLVLEVAACQGLPMPLLRLPCCGRLAESSGANFGEYPATGVSKFQEDCAIEPGSLPLKPRIRYTQSSSPQHTSIGCKGRFSRPCPSSKHRPERSSAGPAPRTCNPCIPYICHLQKTYRIPYKIPSRISYKKTL